MNPNTNENQKIKYSLEDAFKIINLIINEEKEKYENIIKTMNQKIYELNLEIKQLKEENLNYKNKMFEFQDHFYSLSKALYHLNAKPQKKLNEKNQNIYSNKKHNNINKEQFGDKYHTININDNFKFNNKNIYNDLDNLKQSNININDSMSQQLFNKRLFQKVDIKNGSISKSFNYKIKEPTKVIRRNTNTFLQGSLNDLNDNYLKEQNRTISTIKNERKSIDNFDLENYTYKKQDTQKEKFNIIEKRIKIMKKGLSINKLGRNKVNNDNNDFFKAKYNSFMLYNKGNKLNNNNDNFS